MERLLYINGKKIDLYDKPITRNMQIGKVGELNTVSSSYSYTFQIPRTSNNIDVLEYLGVIGNQSEAPYNKLITNYYENGVLLVDNGYSFAKKTKNNNYELNIIDGFITVSQALKGLKLNELNLDNLTHNIGITTYFESRNNTSGYIYALADFGLGVVILSFGKWAIEIENQAPCVFLHTLWDMIFEQAGITVTGNYKDDKFMNEVIAPYKGYTVLLPGSEIKAKDYIPDVLQLDFVKDTVARHGLMIRPIESGVIEIQKIENILKGQYGVVDWSEDIEGEIIEEYSGDFAKINKFIYNYSDEPITNLDGEVIIDSELLINEKELYSSIYEISGLARILQKESGGGLPILKNEIREKVDDVIENISTPYKIFKVERAIADDYLLKLKSIFGDERLYQEGEEFAYLTHNGMDLQDYITTNYSRYSLMIDRFKPITIRKKFSPVELYLLNWFKLVYLKQKSARFKIESIKATSGQISECKLIEVKE